MSSSTTPARNKRRDMDMMKLMMSDYQVQLTKEENLHDFCVKFHGPQGTPYEDGIWKVHVTLPKEYPFKSPSIGFLNRLYHPNVDDLSGSICLDVINQQWSPMFGKNIEYLIPRVAHDPLDLVNIFDIFLPQLLRYPNPSDPLNGEAAGLLLRSPEEYDSKVKEYVKNHASIDINMSSNDEDSDVSEMSDIED